MTSYIVSFSNKHGAVNGRKQTKTFRLSKSSFVAGRSTGNEQKSQRNCSRDWNVAQFCSMHCWEWFKPEDVSSSWSPAVIRRWQEETTESLPTTENAYDRRLAQTWFSDEKLFMVQTPTNTQNDRIYVAVSNKHDVPPRAAARGQKTLFSECHGVGGIIETWQDITGVCWSRC